MDPELELRGLFESNTTFDYSDYIYEDDCVEGRQFMAIFVPVLYSLAMLLGLTGNILVLVVLWQKRRNWSMNDAFALHLSIADTLLLFTLPIWAVDAWKGWIFGSGACKLTGVLFKINFYCSVFLLVFISLYLYISVVHATRICSHRRPYIVQLICLAGWIYSFFLSIPDWIYLKEANVSTQEDNNECVYKYPCKESLMASNLSFFVLGFLLPFIVVLYCFVYILVQCSSKMTVSTQRAVKVTFAMVLVFFISWTPFSVALLIDTFNLSLRKPVESCENHRWTAVKSTAVVGLFHSCLNPLIYLGFSEKLRHWILTIMKHGSCAVDSGDYFLWDSRDFHNAAPVSQEENGAPHAQNNIPQLNEATL